MLREIADHTIRSEELGAYSRADLMAVRERDPACHNLTQPLLFFKGFQAIQAYRVGHALGAMGAKIWPIFSNREFLKSLALIFTPRPLSDAG